MARYVDADKLPYHQIYVPAGGGNTAIVVAVFASDIDAVVEEEVAPVIHAEWIPDDYEFYHCSNCGYEYDEREKVTPFCPGCGAKMEE